MSTQNQNQNGYMLLFRGTDLRKGLSPDAMLAAAGVTSNDFFYPTEIIK